MLLLLLNGRNIAKPRATLSGSSFGVQADTKRFPKVTTYAASYESGAKCISCKTENHPLYVCPTFRAMSHDNKIALLKEKKLCMNCLNGGHFIKSCKSIHRCKRCQRSHHTLLHVEKEADSASANHTPTSLPHSDTIPAISATAIQTLF